MGRPALRNCPHSLRGKHYGCKASSEWVPSWSIGLHRGRWTDVWSRMNSGEGQRHESSQPNLSWFSPLLKPKSCLDTPSFIDFGNCFWSQMVQIRLHQPLFTQIKPRQIPKLCTDPAIEAVINAAPLSSDKKGYFYHFDIPPAHNWLARWAFTKQARTEAKLGCTNNIPRWQYQWGRKCPRQVQQWRACWKVPFAKKNRYCKTAHIEKFDLEMCGGLKGIQRVVGHYLTRLGWKGVRYSEGCRDFLAYTSVANPNFWNYVAHDYTKS
ncbi:hypothetical protein B0H10DRAFT_1937643 [Mycena sp. CBHHK59/15]|nr:hypothetical protein B0H10DRAFT_1937643 [Mycena sp. CBHHK59/15]